MSTKTDKAKKSPSVSSVEASPKPASPKTCSPNKMFDHDDLAQITRTLVPESDRVNVSGRIFGEHFPLRHLVTRH